MTSEVKQARPGTRLRRLVAGLLLLGSSVVVSLGLFEGLLRLAPGLMPETARVYARRQNEGGWQVGTLPHPYIGYLYPANVENTVESRYVAFTYRTDAFGFRNSRPWPQRAEIVALGDSITFSYGVDEDRAWTTLIQKALPRSRLLNLGLPGAAPQQYLRIYETYGLSFQPRLLLVGLFPGNDLKDAAEFDAWVNSGAGGNYDLWRSFRVSAPGLQYLFAGLTKRSYLFAFLLDRLRSGRSEYSSRTLAISLNDGNRLLLVPGLLKDLAERATPDKQEFRLILRTLERLHSLAAEHGTRSIVLLFPTKEEIYLPLVAHGYASDPSAPIRAALNLHGIPYVDLTPHFRGQAAADRALFFETDGHPNARGYALIAEVVLSHLKANSRKYGLKDWETDSSPPGS